MAEDQSAKSSKERFKSKWHRVFKEKEEHEQSPQHVNSFKLDEDVTAFLKPSTDKAGSTRPPSAPKIDIAIAQRWPDAHEVRKASAKTPSSDVQRAFNPNGFTKPKRREGLVVGFVKTVPEIIGEGGDESLEPPSEVGRHKARMSRSVSERKPGATAPGSQWPGSSTGQDSRPARTPNENQDGFIPQPLRRVQTSHHETYPPAQKKSISPPVEDEDNFFPLLTRKSTGFGSKDEHLAHAESSTYGDENAPALPQIDTRFLNEETESPSGSAGSDVRRKEVPSAAPIDVNGLAARKRELRSGEGMALRRASAMIVAHDDDEDEEQKRQELAKGVEPLPQLYETLSRPDAENLMPEVPQPSSALSPQSSTSPSGRSPFDDPKYVKRRSRDAAPEEAQPPPSQSLRQQRPNYQPSYMRAAQPNTTQQLPPAARAPVPQVQPPSQWEEERTSSKRRENQPSYMWTEQQQGKDFTTTRPAPVPSQNTRPPSNSSGSRDASPLRDRILGGDAAPQIPRQFYSRQNNSSGSLNFFPPSPTIGQSRNSSRDGDSPQHVYTGSALQQVSPWGQSQTQNRSPQSGSPRSSTLGKPSMLSPYGRGASPSPQDPLGSQRPLQVQSGRPLGDTLRVEDPASRPGSSSSNRSFQRSANYFSAPRPPQMQAPQPPVVKPQQDELNIPPQPEPTKQSQQRPADYASPPNTHPHTRMRAESNPRREKTQRPSSAGLSAAEPQRPQISPLPTSEGNPAADAAYADFAARVAHMKGVFRLTAEKERPTDRCSPLAWLRTALWWYLRGKAGLEVLLQQRPRSPNGEPRELLMQPHVDLAKTWWILTDPLDPYDTMEDVSPQSAASPGASPEAMLKASVTTLRSHIKSLSLSMSRNQLMPPPQSLIQGQFTGIWLEYPQFTPDAAVVLGGTASRPYIGEQSNQSLPSLKALPLGDTQEMLCYGRFPVDVSVNTDQAETDRVVFPCMLTMLRGRRDFLTSVAIASQNELVGLIIGPRRGDERGLSWHDVSWKAGAFCIIVRLPHGFDLTVRMQERDFRSLWNLVEYARKVEHQLRTEQDEKLVLEARLAEMQYADSLGSNAFPPDKIRRCSALVFERMPEVADASGKRKMHRGYRLLLLTDPDHKSLSSTSHEVCRKGPLLYEFITDSAAHGMAAMVVRIKEESRQCRILLVFPDAGSRQKFYDVLNGLTIGADETIVGKMSLTGMNIEAATQVDGFTQSAHPALQDLQWQRLAITNGVPEDEYSRQLKTIESENLRIVARHSSGCITDRLNLSKGELQLRLPCSQSPVLQMLRNPQEDITMSIDTRHSHASVTNGITELIQTVRQQQTIRTFIFSNHNDLHAFQAAITGLSVRYDGLAASLSIARRRMVVPIYKKWEATNVRLQIVSHSNVVQVLAFMEEFSHAAAMCFQVKSTDVFENVKGDAKGKKWAVKMVDAKFSLPHMPENSSHEKSKEKEKDKGEPEISVEERIKRRFVNLEMLEYAEEHDDITIGFETQEERDRFAQTLPAAATVSRGITLKRRT